MKSSPLRLALLLAVFASVLTLAVSQSLGKRTGAMDQLDLLIDVRQEIVSEYVQKPDEEKMVDAAVRAMVESLDDPYTVYLDPEELKPFDREVRGTFTGIGAEVMMDPDEKRARVVSPLEDSPAWKAGVMAGDLIMEVDGESTHEVSLNDVVNKLLGDEGTKVTVKVRHESGETSELTITRGKIEVQTIKGLRRNGQNHWEFMIDPVSKIGYVRILQFAPKTADDLRAALEQLNGQGMRGLILDLRFDPGGLLEAAVEIADMFLPEGKTIVSIRGRSVPTRVFDSTDKDLAADVPLVVLANEGSASAAEILTGALSDNDRAKFVGARTFGKGSVQQVKMLPSGEGAIKITNAHYYLPSGRNIHRLPDAEKWGVDPQDGFYVPMTPAQVKEMLRIRREGDVLRAATATQPAPKVTAQWIDEYLKDPQFAAGLRTLVHKLDSGEWLAVGESDATALARMAQRESLTRQRDLIQKRLDEIQEQLGKLDRGEEIDAAATQASAEDAAMDEDSLDQTADHPVKQMMPSTMPAEVTQPSDPVPATQP